MAGLGEMNSFIGKFVNLWQAGCDANLKIVRRAGKASVVLQLGLGSPFPQGHPQAAHLTGNAHSQRRERRAAARQVALGNGENYVVAAKETAENVNDKDLIIADKALVEEAREVTAFQVPEATLDVKDEICLCTKV